MYINDGISVIANCVILLGATAKNQSSVMRSKKYDKYIIFGYKCYYKLNLLENNNIPQNKRIKSYNKL